MASNGDAVNRAVIEKALCDQAVAAKTVLMQMVQAKGVYVPVRINNNYPWARIIRLFGATNYDAIKTDYLGQAKERAEMATENLPKSLRAEKSAFLNEFNEVWPTEDDEEGPYRKISTVFPILETMANDEILRKLDDLHKVGSLE